MFGWLTGWVLCPGLPVLVSRLLGCWRLGRPAQGMSLELEMQPRLGDALV